MFSAFSLLSILAIVLSLTSACDYEDCDHLDFGSCGTACCRLSLFIQDETPDEVMVKLNSTLTDGGPDKRYIPMLTAEGTQTFADIRAYHPEVDFIGQAWHTTTNLVYNDTINFLLKPENGGKSTGIFATSISQIAGAYGDDGQNYFNIKQLFDSISWTAGGYKMINADKSCPPPATKQ